ncbi:Dihydroanticapsin 7-dehydrogenase [compost metagenome]
MRATFDAAGDVIVITGGANGIGAELARACAQAGATVVICDVDERAASGLLADAPGVQFRRLDVSDRDAVMQVMQAIEAEHGRIDSLVCGAAVQPRMAVHETDPQAWQKTLAVNLDGVVWCYQAVVPGMIRRRRGSVVAFSSGLAHSGWPQSAAYASSKAALSAFVKSAAKEVAQHRVRVNLIAPGVIDTPQYRDANAGNDNAHWAATLGVGRPEDVTGPLMFLLSDAATMTASLVSRDHAYPAREAAGGAH